MSWEEDFLMKRVGDIVKALKGADMLDECAKCTTLFAADLDHCPNCGHPAGKPADWVPPREESDTPEQTGEGGATTVETIDGQPAAYDSANVEQLKAELDRRGVFYPGNAKRAEVLALLAEDDKQRAAAEHGS